MSHLTESRICHFTDILHCPVYAVLHQSPLYAILQTFCFHKQFRLNLLSDNNSVKKIHVNLMFRHQQHLTVSGKSIYMLKITIYSSFT